MRHYTKEFDALGPSFATKRVRIERSTSEDLASIYPRIVAAFKQHMATLETCEHIRRRHVDNIWSIKKGAW